MALFTGRVVKKVVYEYQAPRKPVREMEEMKILCHEEAHPMPVRMVHIGTIPHDKYGWMYIYACPYGRYNGDPCGMREGWVIGHKGEPFRLWRGEYDGRK